MDFGTLVVFAAGIWGFIAVGVMTLCRAAANADRQSERLQAELLSRTANRQHEALAALIRRAVTGA